MTAGITAVLSKLKEPLCFIKCIRFVLHYCAKALIRQNVKQHEDIYALRYITILGGLIYTMKQRYITTCKVCTQLFSSFISEKNTGVAHRKYQKEKKKLTSCLIICSSKLYRPNLLCAFFLSFSVILFWGLLTGSPGVALLAFAKSRTSPYVWSRCVIRGSNSDLLEQDLEHSQRNIAKRNLWNKAVVLYLVDTYRRPMRGKIDHCLDTYARTVYEACIRARQGLWYNHTLRAQEMA